MTPTTTENLMERHATIEAMCRLVRPNFDEDYWRSSFFAHGTTNSERQEIRTQMAKLYDEFIAPLKG